MFVREKLIRSLVQNYEKHTVYTDGGAWYDEACNVLRLKHHLHSSIQKSMIERVNQYFKDRIESFDDYYPHLCKKMNVISFMYIIGYNPLTMYNDTTFENYFINELNERGEYILN